MSDNEDPKGDQTWHAEGGEESRFDRNYLSDDHGSLPLACFKASEASEADLLARKRGRKRREAALAEPTLLPGVCPRSDVSYSTRLEGVWLLII